MWGQGLLRSPRSIFPRTRTLRLRRTVPGAPPRPGSGRRGGHRPLPVDRHPPRHHSGLTCTGTAATCPVPGGASPPLPQSRCRSGFPSSAWLPARLPAWLGEGHREVRLQGRPEAPLAQEAAAPANHRLGRLVQHQHRLPQVGLRAAKDVSRPSIRPGPLAPAPSLRYDPARRAAGWPWPSPPPSAGLLEMFPVRFSAGAARSAPSPGVRTHAPDAITGELRRRASSARITLRDVSPSSMAASPFDQHELTKGVLLAREVFCGVRDLRRVKSASSAGPLSATTLPTVSISADVTIHKERAPSGGVEMAATRMRRSRDSAGRDLRKTVAESDVYLFAGYRKPVPEPHHRGIHESSPHGRRIAHGPSWCQIHRARLHADQRALHAPGGHHGYDRIRFVSRLPGDTVTVEYRITEKDPAQQRCSPRSPAATRGGGRRHGHPHPEVRLISLASGSRGRAARLVPRGTLQGEESGGRAMTRSTHRMPEATDPTSRHPASPSAPPGRGGGAVVALRPAPAAGAQTASPSSSGPCRRAPRPLHRRVRSLPGGHHHRESFADDRQRLTTAAPGPHLQPGGAPPLPAPGIGRARLGAVERARYAFPAAWP